MKGSRSKRLCSSSSCALTLRLIALRCLKDRSSWMAEPVHDGQEFLDDPADFGVLRRREIVEKLHKLADEAERSRHQLAGIVEGDFLSLGIQFREEEAIGEHLRGSG